MPAVLCKWATDLIHCLNIFSVTVMLDILAKIVKSISTNVQVVLVKIMEGVYKDQILPSIHYLIPNWMWCYHQYFRESFHTKTQADMNAVRDDWKWKKPGSCDLRFKLTVDYCSMLFCFFFKTYSFAGNTNPISLMIILI